MSITDKFQPSIKTDQTILGVLGFLATGNGPNDIKGNFGILDQRMAIAWVKDNINAFGGDPNQV